MKLHSDFREIDTDTFLSYFRGAVHKDNYIGKFNLLIASGDYFAPNSSTTLDENSLVLNALFIEWDDITIDKQLEKIEEIEEYLPSKFNIQLHTGGRSIHNYLLLKPDEYLTIESWKYATKLLIVLAGSDSSICNANRLMRLPNRIHQKTGHLSSYRIMHEERTSIKAITDSLEKWIGEDLCLEIHNEVYNSNKQTGKISIITEDEETYLKALDEAFTKTDFSEGKNNYSQGLKLCRSAATACSISSVASIISKHIGPKRVKDYYRAMNTANGSITIGTLIHFCNNNQIKIPFKKKEDRILMEHEDLTDWKRTKADLSALGIYLLEYNYKIYYSNNSDLLQWRDWKDFDDSMLFNTVARLNDELKYPPNPKSKAEFELPKYTPTKLKDLVKQISSFTKLDPGIIELERIEQTIPYDKNFPDYISQVASNLWEFDKNPLALTFRQMVARILTPGCTCPQITIINGPQGHFKSEVAKFIVIDRRFLLEHFEPMMNEKEIIEQTENSHLVEMDELTTNRVKDLEKYKGLITRTKDKARKSYGYFSQEVKRGFAIIATTNEEQCLPDDASGQRRFYPVSIALKQKWLDIKDPQERYKTIKSELLNDSNKEKCLRQAIYEVKNNYPLYVSLSKEDLNPYIKIAREDLEPIVERAVINFKDCDVEIKNKSIAELWELICMYGGKQEWVERDKRLFPIFMNDPFAGHLKNNFNIKNVSKRLNPLLKQNKFRQKKIKGYYKWDLEVDVLTGVV